MWCAPLSFYETYRELFFNQSDEGQIAIFFGAVHSVADQKTVSQSEKGKIWAECSGSRNLFFNGNRTENLSRSRLFQFIGDSIQRKTGIEHIVQYQYLFPVHIGQGIVPYQASGGDASFAVTGNFDRAGNKTRRE